MNNNYQHIVQFLHNDGKKIVFEKALHTAQPGHLYARPGDTIQFVPRNTGVTIYIPNANQLFAGLSQDDLIIRLDPGQPSQPYSISYTDNRRFPYAVYCHDGNDFAEGGTSPAVIIDP